MAQNKQKSNTKTIKIENELSLNNVSNVRELLIKTLKEKDDLTLNLKNINNIDLAGIQLIVSLKSYVEKNNKKLTLNLELNDESKELLLNSGFNDYLNITTTS